MRLYHETADAIGAYAYDAAAAVALALRELHAQGGGTDRASPGAVHGDRLTAALRAVRFSGSSGNVSFKSGLGDRATDALDLLM